VSALHNAPPKSSKGLDFAKETRICCGQSRTAAASARRKNSSPAAGRFFVSGRRGLTVAVTRGQEDEGKSQFVDSAAVACKQASSQAKT
ncbi:unnamed protein product, partial [Symbiodinium necroappetens]